jgi:organic radical activating enzyme
MRRLTLSEIEATRRVPGRSALLFITDRCPVGCTHCSVDSRPDSPRITDFNLFGEIVAGIAAIGSLETVGISGGEPFTERRGLPLAMREFTAAGKNVVIYTSGYWAAGNRYPAWIRQVLRQTSTVILSTDSFHQRSVGRERFARAVELCADAGCHIVAQVLDEAENVPFVEETMARILGQSWPDRADVSRITPLQAGRGRDVFQISRAHPVDKLSPCPLLASPTIRYDGAVTGCCNETVIMGGGPAALRARVKDGGALRTALDHFREDPLLRAIGTVRPEVLTALPLLDTLADRRFRDICGLCWQAHEVIAREPATTGRLLSAVTAISTPRKVGR